MRTHVAVRPASCRPSCPWLSRNAEAPIIRSTSECPAGGGGQAHDRHPRSGPRSADGVRHVAGPRGPRGASPHSPHQPPPAVGRAGRGPRDDGGAACHPVVVRARGLAGGQAGRHRGRKPGPGRLGRHVRRRGGDQAPLREHAPRRARGARERAALPPPLRGEPGRQPAAGQGDRPCRRGKPGRGGLLWPPAGTTAGTDPGIALRRARSGGDRPARAAVSGWRRADRSPRGRRGTRSRGRGARRTGGRRRDGARPRPRDRVRRHRAPGERVHAAVRERGTAALGLGTGAAPARQRDPHRAELTPAVVRVHRGDGPGRAAARARPFSRRFWRPLPGRRAPGGVAELGTVGRRRAAGAALPLGGLLGLPPGAGAHHGGSQHRAAVPAPARRLRRLLAVPAHRGARRHAWADHAARQPPPARRQRPATGAAARRRRSASRSSTSGCGTRCATSRRGTRSRGCSTGGTSRRRWRASWRGPTAAPTRWPC